MKLRLDFVRAFVSAVYFVGTLLASAFVYYFGRGYLAERGVEQASLLAALGAGAIIIVAGALYVFLPLLWSRHNREE
jgi:hypothetical protein